LPIRVFLITDFGLLRVALEALLASEPRRFALSGGATVYEQAVAAVRDAAPDLVLLDIDGLGEHALELIAELHATSPAKILLLTRLADSTLQDKAVLLGARGVVDRKTAPEMLMTAIERVMAGQVWLDREATGRIFVQFSRASYRQESDPVSARLALLTEREKAIVACIAKDGHEPGKTVARKLNISESTLRNHLTSIYEKLGVGNRNGLLTYAFRNGLAERLSSPGS
jgi:DNA-binding NarL/FixJ family response regulator